MVVIRPGKTRTSPVSESGNPSEKGKNSMWLWKTELKKNTKHHICFIVLPHTKCKIRSDRSETSCSQHKKLRTAWLSRMQAHSRAGHYPLVTVLYQAVNCGIVRHLWLLHNSDEVMEAWRHNGINADILADGMRFSGKWWYCRWYYYHHVFDDILICVCLSTLRFCLQVQQAYTEKYPTRLEFYWNPSHVNPHCMYRV